MKIFANLFSRKPVVNTLNEAIQNSKETLTEVITKPIINHIPKEPTIAQSLNSFKVYYDVNTNIEPIRRRFGNLYEKIYKCKDGGDVVVSYTTHRKGNSELRISKVGNSNDQNRGGFFPYFYSNLKTTTHTNQYGDSYQRAIRKKGAQEQILSTENGVATERIHTPLKRWEKSNELFNDKKIISNINPWNPKDFERIPD